MAADVTSLTSASTVRGKDVTVKVDMGNIYINDAKVILADIEASNSVIHVIDSVLLPPAEGAMMDKTIVDMAVADGRFMTLVAALGAAGLVEIPARRWAWAITPVGSNWWWMRSTAKSWALQ
ncbi:MAG: hypothetical protein EHM81_07810 [Chloroflexi bacterium]|nr:MAG: hypothetical protein EHM81_07810 [Chloroflexota bacterium]